MLDFDQIDVFTDEFLLGNPLAVVHGADALTDAQMAAVARWTNLSETTFLLRPTLPGADYRVRIFTPVDEMPFAGHPTLGSARAWLERGGVPASGDELVQECGVGLVRVRRTGARLAFAAPPLIRGDELAPADVAGIAEALHVRVDEVIGARWADNGSGWVAVLLADADTVLGLDPLPSPVGPFVKVGVVGAHPAGSDVALEVRAFTPGKGTGEDPVTGSLHAAIAQWLVPAGVAPTAYTAAQGTRLRRRGRVHVEQVDGTIWVGGDTVVGITGRITEPG